MAFNFLFKPGLGAKKKDEILEEYVHPSMLDGVIVKDTAAKLGNIVTPVSNPPALIGDPIEVVAAYAHATKDMAKEGIQPMVPKPEIFSRRRRS